MGPARTGSEGLLTMRRGCVLFVGLMGAVETGPSPIRYEQDQSGYSPVLHSSRICYPSPNKPKDSMPLSQKVFDQVVAELTVDEGFRETPYFCPAKKLTVGYGRNITDRGFTVAEAEMILKPRGLDPGPEQLYEPVSSWLVVGAIESAPLTRSEATKLLHYDIALAEMVVREILPRFESFTPNRQAALLNMVVNLGGPRLLGFRKMLRAIRAGKWQEAAAEALASKWARQVGSRRSGRIAEQLRDG